MTSLLEFYQQHEISPVRQDVTDLPAHFARRAALYRSLGLPPFAFRWRRVLEIGPGGGENALYTLSLQPSRYLLLEPNPTAAALLKQRLGRTRCQIIEQTLERFYSPKLFDFVLCEGLLGLSGGDSTALLAAAAQHVKPGGILVITCIDAISDHAEIVRRAHAQQIIDRAAPLADQLAQLRPIFAPHLATLAGMTRSVDDWMLDNLLNPASIGPTFSIPDACAALNSEFDLLGCSPRFLTDWRWYKHTTHGNQWAIDCYWTQAHNLLDYRRVLSPDGEFSNRKLMADCLAYRAQLRAFEAGEGEPPFANLTDLGWFGRGQQYLSFTRRESVLS